MLFIACLVGLLHLAPISSAEQTITFADVRAILDEARSERADLFSSGLFQSGLNALNQAREDSAAGRSERRIDQDLQAAYSFFEKALTTAKQMCTSFPGLVDAYDDAQAAEAQTRAPERYESAVRSFDRVVTKLERGDTESASREAERAIQLLRQAELEAIKSDVLGPVKDLQRKAAAARSSELTPSLYAQADEALKRTERYIEEHRYDRETAERMAQETADILSHALYMTERISSLKERSEGWETLILQYEQYIDEIGRTLQLDPRFDRDAAIAVESIKASIRALQDDLRYLQGELANRDVRIGELEAEIRKLQGQSGKYLAELEVKRQQIQEQKRFEDKVKRITSLFEPQEGSIIYTTSGDSNQIVIRLTGLQFKSGSGDIQPEYFDLLERAGQVIREFPDYRIEIHGHTDSKGDEADNLKLSQARAHAVKEYFVKSLDLPEADIKAIGFGESRPLVSNDTAAGRAQNRRIEIILKR